MEESVVNMDLSLIFGERYGLVLIICSVSVGITEALISMVDLADSLLSAESMPEDIRPVDD